MITAPQKLIVLGDSGVYGWGDREGGGWCERLRRHWMENPGAPVLYPLGVRGDGLENVASRWKDEWFNRGELRRTVPDGILISIGLNDTARIGRLDGRPQLSWDAYRFGLGQLLKDMTKHSHVMVLGLTPVDEEMMPFAKCLWYSNKFSEIYEAQIEEVCLELNIPFMPLLHSMLNEPNWLTFLEPDGIHLNNTGHSWIYHRLVNWMPLLKWSKLSREEAPTPIL